MSNFKDAKILIVDDEKMNIRLLEVILKTEGYTYLQSTTNPHQFYGVIY